MMVEAYQREWMMMMERPPWPPPPLIPLPGMPPPPMLAPGAPASNAGAPPATPAANAALPRAPPGLSEVPTHEVVRDAVLRDIEAKVAEKMEELWQKGRQMLSQVHQKQQERTEKLMAQIQQCKEQQDALERENQALKQVLTKMASHLSQLGLEKPAGGRAEGPREGRGYVSPPTTMATSLTTTPQRTQTSDGHTPQPDVEVSASTPPEVPPFHFAQPPAPLSLAEALSSSAPRNTALTPLSLASTLAAEAQLAQSWPPQVFSMTLRKADGAQLGLDVKPLDGPKDRSAWGGRIRPDGAVEAWNRQCVGTNPERAIIAGDQIVSVNSVSYEPDKMLEECRDKQLLKLTLVRGEISEAGGSGRCGLCATRYHRGMPDDGSSSSSGLSTDEVIEETPAKPSPLWETGATPPHQIPERMLPERTPSRGRRNSVDILVSKAKSGAAAAMQELSLAPDPKAEEKRRRKRFSEAWAEPSNVLARHVSSMQHGCGSSSSTRFVMKESNPFRKFWNFVIGILLLYTGTVFPYKLAFIEFYINSSSEMEDEVKQAWFPVEQTVDILFWTDLHLGCEGKSTTQWRFVVRQAAPPLMPPRYLG
eukprot:g29852.t2